MSDPVHTSLKKYKGLGLYLSPELENSKAWNDAGEYGRKLFWCLHNGLKWTRLKDKNTGKEVKEYSNHMELAFTQAEFCNKYKCHKQTYTNARNRLIYVGLIRITHKGGNGRGDYTKYQLFYQNGDVLSVDEEGKYPYVRWRHYPEENWKVEIPTSKHRIGIKNRFEKGECGRHRKKKPTLSKPPLNGGIPLSQ